MYPQHNNNKKTNFKSFSHTHTKETAEPGQLDPMPKASINMTSLPSFPFTTIIHLFA
jgi:hypothetical protein